jgi:rod shape determining protein RodA
MYQHTRFNSDQSFFQKIKNLDYILLVCLILLSALSLFVMYSTDGGEILYHTKSHFTKIIVFFVMMLVISFFNIKFWHFSSYIFYSIIIFLLIWFSIYGVKVSGSQRWINLYLIVLQPSELMKIGIILCLAKYYHRLSSEKVNSFLSISVVLTIVLIPVILVVSQPDLGTSILIASSGLIVLWLGGVKIKYFFMSFIAFLISLPFMISILQPYQKLRILTFLNPDRDPLGAGYQIIQSKIAIGSGGFSGKGFLKGTQSYLDFLPEKHTDFIFTLFSEEFGYY